MEVSDHLIQASIIDFDFDPLRLAMTYIDEEEGSKTSVSSVLRPILELRL
jgi:hypothetical protein